MEKPFALTFLSALPCPNSSPAARARACGPLVIDEGFGTQDAEGLDHLVEAIQAISGDFEKILIITHVESLKQAFPVRIEVTKYPDLGSRFEVLY